MNQAECLEKAAGALEEVSSTTVEWAAVYVNMAHAYIALADRLGGYGLPSLSDVFTHDEASKPRHSGPVEVEESTEPVQVHDDTQSIPTVSQ